MFKVPEIEKPLRLSRENMRAIAEGGKLKLGEDLGWEVSKAVPLGISYIAYEPVGKSYSDENGHFQCDGEAWNDKRPDRPPNEADQKFTKHESAVNKAFFKITYIKMSTEISGEVVNIGPYNDGSCIMQDNESEQFCYNHGTGENIFVIRARDKLSDCKVALTSRTPFFGQILSSELGKVFLDKKRKVLVKLLQETEICGGCPVFTTNIKGKSCPIKHTLSLGWVKK